MKILFYPNRIALRAPFWQRLIFPVLIPFIIYLIAKDISLQTANGYTTGATIALVVFALLEILFLARFFLDGTLVVDSEGVSFAILGKKHYYRWTEINYISSLPIQGLFPYYNVIYLHNNKGIVLTEYYGFLGGKRLGKFLKAYHKAAVEAQGVAKQE